MTQGAVPPFVTSPSRRGTPATNDPIPYFGATSDASAGGMDFFNTLGNAKPNNTSAVQQQPSQYQQQHHQPPHSYQASSSSSQIHQQQSYQQPLQQVSAPMSQPYMGYQQYQQYQQSQQYQSPPREVPPRSATGPAVDYPYQGYGYASHAANYTTTTAADPYRSTSVVYGGTQYNGMQYGYQQQVQQLAENPLPVTTSTLAPIAAAEGAAPADAVSFFDQLASSNTYQATDPVQNYQHSQLQQQSDYNGGNYSAVQSNGTFAQVPTLEAAETSNYGYDVSASVAQIQHEDTQHATAGGQGDADASNGVIYDEASGQYYDTNSGQFYDNASGTWYYPQQSTEYDAGAHEPSTYPVAEADSSAPLVQAQQMETASKANSLVSAIQAADTSTTGVISQQVTDTLDGASFFDELNIVASSVEVANADAVPPQTVQQDPSSVAGQHRQATPTVKVQLPDSQQLLNQKADMDQQEHVQGFTAPSLETHPVVAADIAATSASAEEPILNTGAVVEVPVVSETIDNIDAVVTSVSVNPVSTNPTSIAPGTLTLGDGSATSATNADVVTATESEKPVIDSSIRAEAIANYPESSDQTDAPHAIRDDVAYSEITAPSTLPESSMSTLAASTVATDTGHIPQTSLAERADMPNVTQLQQQRQQIVEQTLPIISNQLYVGREHNMTPQSATVVGDDLATATTVTTISDSDGAAMSYSQQSRSAQLSASEVFDYGSLSTIQPSVPALSTTSANWSQMTEHDSASSMHDGTVSLIADMLPASVAVSDAPTVTSYHADDSSFYNYQSNDAPLNTAAVATVIDESLDAHVDQPELSSNSREITQNGGYQHGVPDNDASKSAAAAVSSAGSGYQQPNYDGQYYADDGMYGGYNPHAVSYADDSSYVPPPPVAASSTDTAGVTVPAVSAVPEVTNTPLFSGDGTFSNGGGNQQQSHDYWPQQAYQQEQQQLEYSHQQQDYQQQQPEYPQQQQEHQQQQPEYPQQQQEHQQQLHYSQHQQEYQQQEYQQQQQEHQQQQTEYYQQQQEYQQEQHGYQPQQPSFEASLGGQLLNPYAPATNSGVFTQNNVAPDVASAQVFSGAQRSVDPSGMVPAVATMAPIPPAAAVAAFDLYSQSERTSTDFSYYDRDPNSVGYDQQQQQQMYSDPLGRLGACRPVISFGFGGTVITMFPRNVQRFNVYDSGKASKIAPGMLQVQQLSTIVPTEVCGDGNPSLLGVPLLAGETTRAMLIKRRDAAVAGAKAWIEAARASSAPPSDAEIALYKIIIAMLEAFESTPDSTKSLDISAILDVLRPWIKQQPTLAPVQDTVKDSLPISNGSVQQLEQIESLLLAGNRREAVDTACRQGLWTHALIIASCTGKDLWQTVVSAYTKSVLSDSHPALGIQYRMFSGLGAGALDDPRMFHGLDQDNKDDAFITAASLGGSSHSHVDPLHQEKSSAYDLSVDACGERGDTATNDWARVLSLMLANRTSGDQDAIMLLGDRLKSEGSTVQAHICYALTRQGKAIFTPDSTDSRPRAVLLGISETVRATGHGNVSFDMTMTRFSQYYRKPSAMFATELYELLYALKTASATESQPSGAGAASSSSNGASVAAAASASNQHSTKPATLLCLPHLQAYKLYYAWWLVDCGHVALASRYCDAVLSILATLPPGMAVPFISNSLVQELRNLRERLSGAGMTSTKAAEIVGDDSAIGGATSKSWLSRAMPRPSFTSLMTVFDSSIDKFITGADGNRISLEPGATPGKFEVGPDRHAAQSFSGSEQMVHKNPPRPLGAVTWDGRTPSPHTLAASVSAAGSTDGYLASYSSPRQSMDGRPSISSIHRDSNPEPPRMFTPSNFGLQNEPAVPEFTSYLHQQQSQEQQQQQQQQPRWGDPSGTPSSTGNAGFVTPSMPFIPTASAVQTAGFSQNYGGGSGAIEGSNSANPSIPQAYSGYGGQYAEPQTLAANSQTGTSANAHTGTNAMVGDDDEEDMFGFSKKKPASVQPGSGNARPSADGPRSSTPSTRPSVDKKDDKADGQADEKAASGVFGIIKSLWGGRKNQANLGEESNFVFDPVLKRWVDKNAVGEHQDVGPPPPPPPSMKFQPQSQQPPPHQQQQQQQSMSVPPGMSYGLPPASASIPGSTGSMAALQSHANGMPGTSRPPSVIPPLASVDLSRTGTPGSTFESSSPATAGGMPAPPSSGGSRQVRRRGARSKYVDLVGQ